ncbi:MAG: LysM domain-containing protein, partial [Methylococcales bacterium]
DIAREKIQVLETTTVTEGSTLSDIAKEYLEASIEDGDPAPSVEQIKIATDNLATFNNIADPNQIMPGQKIEVPNMFETKQLSMMMDGSLSEAVDLSMNSQSGNSGGILGVNVHDDINQITTEGSSHAESCKPLDLEESYSQAFTHTVEPGDTLSELVADKYENLTGEKPTQGQIWNMVYEVAEHNKIANVDLIHVGDTISFPQGLELTNEKFNPDVAMQVGKGIAHAPIIPDVPVATPDWDTLDKVFHSTIIDSGETLSNATSEYYERLTGDKISDADANKLAEYVASLNGIEDFTNVDDGSYINFPSDLVLKADDLNINPILEDDRSLMEKFGDSLSDTFGSDNEHLDNYRDRISSDVASSPKLS